METPAAPFEPYEGPEPYVYVSYGHADAQSDAWSVYPLISKLHRAGLRIWYDKGLHEGDHWPKVNELKVLGCTAFILFITRFSVSSHTVQSEVTNATNNGKPVLKVSLERTQLPVGMNQQLINEWDLKAYELPSDQVETRIVGYLKSIGLSTDPIPEPTPEPRPHIDTSKPPPSARPTRKPQVSDTFTDRVPESQVVAGAVERQLARVRRDEGFEAGVFPHVEVFHGQSGVGKSGLVEKLELWVAADPPSGNGRESWREEWGPWPHDPVIPVRWSFHNSAGRLEMTNCLIRLRQALNASKRNWPAFDLALASYLIAKEQLAQSGEATSGMLRSLQLIANDNAWSKPESLTSENVRLIRDLCIENETELRGTLEPFATEGYIRLRTILDRCRKLPHSDRAADERDLVANLMELLTLEIFLIPPAERPVLVVFLDALERLQRAATTDGETTIATVIANLQYALFVVTSQDELNWHDPRQHRLDHCGPEAWPTLTNQHKLERLSSVDTRRIYEEHRRIHRWRISDQLLDKLVTRSAGLPLHIDVVLKLAHNLESKSPGHNFTAEELDQPLEGLVPRLLESLTARERNAFRAMCVLPFFDVGLAASIMTGDDPDKVAAVEDAIRHAPIDLNPEVGSCYPYVIHDETRDQVRRDQLSEGFWAEADWRTAAQRGFQEARRRIQEANANKAYDDEIQAVALAIRLAYANDLPIGDLTRCVTEAPTIAGLLPLLPGLPTPPPKTEAAGVISFVEAYSRPLHSSIDALDRLYRDAAYASSAKESGRFLAYRLRQAGRRDEALAVFKELLGRFPDQSALWHRQYAITLRGGRRFKDCLDYAAANAPKNLPRQVTMINRFLGLLDEDLQASLDYAATFKSERTRREIEISVLESRARVAGIEPAEVEVYLERAERGDRADCLSLLGQYYLADPEKYDLYLAQTKQVVESIAGAGPQVAELLCLKALMTRDPADAEAAYQMVAQQNEPRAAGWIRIEVWLEELGYHLPEVPTQWIIPYEQVRENWLRIAEGIIARAKANAALRAEILFLTSFVETPHANASVRSDRLGSLRAPE